MSACAASDLAKDQKLNFGDDIAIQLRMARKRRWQLLEEKRLQQEIELQTYINQLILRDKDRIIQEMKQNGARQVDLDKVEDTHVRGTYLGVLALEDHPFLSVIHRFHFVERLGAVQVAAALMANSIPRNVF